MIFTECPPGNFTHLPKGWDKRQFLPLSFICLHFFQFSVSCLHYSYNEHIYILKTKKLYSLDLSSILYLRRVEVEQSAGNRGGVRMDFSGQAASESTIQARERTHPALAALCFVTFAACYMLSPRLCWPHPLGDTRSPSLPMCPVCLLPGVRGERARGRDTAGTVRREAQVRWSSQEHPFLLPRDMSQTSSRSLSGQ